MRTTEGEEDTPLTVGILFSLDRCLLMGDPEAFLAKTRNFGIKNTLLSSKTTPFPQSSFIKSTTYLGPTPGAVQDY